MGYGAMYQKNNILHRKEFWALLEKFIKILSLFSVIYFGGILSQGEFGLFIINEIYLSYFVLFLFFGFDAIGVRVLVDYGVMKGVKIIFLTRITLSIFILVCLAIFHGSVQYSNHLILICAISPLCILEQLHYKNNDYIVVYKTKILGNFLALFLRFYALVDIEHAVSILLFSLSIEHIFIGVLSITNKGKILFESIKAQCSLNELKEVVFSGALLLTTTFIVVTSSKVEQLMIEKFIDLERLGQYALATKFSAPFVFIPVLYCTLYLPKAYTGKHTTPFTNDFLINFLSGLMFISLISYFASILLAVAYVNTIGLNLDYTILCIYGLGLPLSFFGVFVTQMNIYMNDMKGRIIRLVVGLLFSLPLIYGLVVSLGILGASISYVLTLLIVNVFLLVTSDKTKWLLGLAKASLVNMPSFDVRKL